MSHTNTPLSILLKVLENRAAEAQESGNPFRQPQKPTDGDKSKKKKKKRKPDGSGY